MFGISQRGLFYLAVASFIVLAVLAPVLMLAVGGVVAWSVVGVSMASLGSSAFGLLHESY